MKNERTKNLRYKRAALDSMGYDSILQELYEIQESCADVHYLAEQDRDALLNALDDDEEAEWEFKIAFSELEYNCDRLLDAMQEYRVQEDYDDCTVALIGNRYNTIGWDGIEEDYFSLCAYDQTLAHTEAGKRLMRKTKTEIISTVGQCVGALVAFLDIRQRYDYLKATFDILKDENTSLLQQIKEIEKAYEEAESVQFDSWEYATAKFDNLVACLPDKVWIE